VDAIDRLEARDPAVFKAGDEVAIVHALHAELGAINAGSSAVLFDIEQQLLDDGIQFWHEPNINRLKAIVNR
jgi:hypothetical protein